MATYKKNQSIAKGLLILEAVSDNPGLSITALSSFTGIHRTTLYRMIETLEDLGYIRKRNSDDRYFITQAVSKLGRKASANSEIIDAAAPCLRELNKQIEWPSSLITPKNKTMVIQETTHGRSKIHVHNVGIGTTVPFFTSAAGRAYLSHCNTTDREKILENIDLSLSNSTWPVINHSYIESILKKTKLNGFALSIGEAEKWLSGIAMPVLKDDIAIASINIVFLSGCINEKKAINHYLPLLKDTIHQIESSLNLA